MKSKTEFLATFWQPKRDTDGHSSRSFRALATYPTGSHEPVYGCPVCSHVAAAQVARDELENSKKRYAVSAHIAANTSIGIRASRTVSGIARVPVASRPAEQRHKRSGSRKRRITIISRACLICCGCRIGAARTRDIGDGELRSVVISPLENWPRSCGSLRYKI